MNPPESNLEVADIVLLVVLNLILVLAVIQAGRMIVSGRRAARLPRQQRFQADRAQIRNLVLDAIQSIRGRVTREDEDTIEFRTGLSLYSWRGQNLAVRLLDNQNGWTHVDFLPSFRRARQLYDWHEAERIIQRLFRYIESRLEGSSGRP